MARDRVALYTRVSTDEQNPENQLLVLRAWAQDRGHRVVIEVADVGTGSRHREALDDLYDLARAGKIDTLAIWSLDRLTRQGPLQTLQYVARFQEHGVGVYSNQEPYLNPEFPFYESIVALIADIAKMERTRLIERTNAGIARARAKGVHVGRPRGAKDKRKRRSRASRAPSAAQSLRDAK